MVPLCGRAKRGTARVIRRREREKCGNQTFLEEAKIKYVYKQVRHAPFSCHETKMWDYN
jgi:hypothetical protein